MTRHDGSIRRAIPTRAPVPTSTAAFGIDWGVYGVPETFVITKDGRIAYKQIGPLSVEVLEKKIIPLIETLNKQPSPEVAPAADAAMSPRPG